MKRLNMPGFVQAPVFAACLQGVGSLDANARCTAIAEYMNQQEVAYRQLALAGDLHLWNPHPRGGDHELALGQVTRGEFKGLYSDHMARSGKPARTYYDQLRMSAPNNICPYCRIGVVETIDHFLPKGRYSSLSVLPLNLVPACRDCNTGKLDGVATIDSLSSHPYFENQCVFTDEWLCAQIISDPVLHVAYSAVTPAGWDGETSQRVTSHFRVLDLARRFSVQAAGRLAFYANLVNDIAGAGGDVAAMLRLTNRAELAAHGLNSWQAALAKAVEDDQWFCSEGYAQLL